MSSLLLDFNFGDYIIYVQKFCFFFKSICSSSIVSYPFIVVSMPFIYLMTLVIFYVLSDCFLSCVHIVSIAKSAYWLFFMLLCMTCKFLSSLEVFYWILCVCLWSGFVLASCCVWSRKKFRTSFCVHFLAWSCCTAWIV